MSLDTVARSFRSHVADQGADLDHFAAGPRGLGIAMRSTHTLSADDVLYVDYGCVLQSVHSDSGLTLALATPSTDLLTRYNVLRASVERGATTLRAGLRASAVWRAMHDAVDTVNGIVSSPHGHGLGLEAREYPLIVPDSGLRIRDDCIDESADLELELGMVVNLEASTFIPGVASLHVERSYVVGAAAGSPLIAQERDRPIVPGADRPQAPVHDLVHLETRPG
jgi:Xaa-Pro aminopeptidase